MPLLTPTRAMWRHSPAQRRCGVAAAAAVIVAAAVAGGAQEIPTFRSAARLVVLQVTVLSRNGDVVTDLDREAFSVREDGVPQPITLFGREDVPVSVGILLDNSGSMRAKRQKVEAAALAFVRASNPQDEVFVLNFADEPHLDVPFTSDIARVEAGIARVDAIGGTAMRDAIEAGVDYLVAHATRDRKALLVVTDGQDNASVAPMDRIRRKVATSDAVIYAVGLLADEAAPQANRARSELEDCTELSGGRAWFPDRLDDIDAAVVDIAHHLRSLYTIAYSPQNQALNGSYRKVHVEVHGHGRLSVRTRDGYLASRESGPPSPPLRRQ